MRSSPSSALARPEIRLDDAPVIHHQYHPRRVRDEGRQGTFDVMTQFFGLVRGQLSSVALAIIILFAAGLPLRGQTPEQQQQGPPVIKSVEIQYVGPQTLSRDKILSQMRTKPGQPYSEALVEQDIKALYR